MIRKSLFALALVLVPYQVARGESARVVGRVDCSLGCRVTDLEIVGEIDNSTVEKIKQLFDESHQRAVRERKAASSVYEVVNLNSPGGSVTAALAIGRMLRKERLAASVGVGGVCYSSCVMIYAGAVSRVPIWVSSGKIGIHRPYFEVPRQDVSPENVKELYQRMLQDLRAYFREMNVSEQLADAMLRIEPQNIRLLDDAALNSYGLTETDPIEEETHDLEMAQMYGLDRSEYMKRKSFAERICIKLPTMSRCHDSIMKTGTAAPELYSYPGRAP
jgi:ATP-dependent protease ClpP protease subunit